jgi:hypothetical protein
VDYEICSRFWQGKYLENKLGVTRRQEDNIMILLQETGCKDGLWMAMDHDQV